MKSRDASASKNVEKIERNVQFPDLFERKGYADDGEFDWTGRTMSTPVNNCLHKIRTTVCVIGPQVQNQDPISPSGRGRHNTGKDGKVRVSFVVASNLEQILLCHLRERQRGANRSPQASISWWGEAG